MKKEIADKWVAALRSGDYKQCAGSLRIDDSFCCLGVLCNLHAQEHPKIAAKETNPDIYLGHEVVLPQEVIAWAGSGHREGELRDGSSVTINGIPYMSLSEANDDGVSFNEIADFIEAMWEQL